MRLYYQAVSKDYVDFLLAENNTTDDGQILYDLWDANGRGAPELMAEATASVEILTEVETRTGLQYSLGRMAPNPFQGRTAFHFSLAKPGWVRLAVYDVRGRKVKTLENEIRPAGSYTMHWDGRDENGASLASGVYFLRLQSGDFVASQRVTLVR